MRITITTCDSSISTAIKRDENASQKRRESPRRHRGNRRLRYSFFSLSLFRRSCRPILALAANKRRNIHIVHAFALNNKICAKRDLWPDVTHAFTFFSFRIKSADSTLADITRTIPRTIRCNVVAILRFSESEFRLSFKLSAI